MHSRVGLLTFLLFASLACDQPFLFDVVELEAPDTAGCGPAPENLAADVSDGNIHLTWSHAGGVTGFVVRRNVEGAGWVDLDETEADALELTDDNGILPDLEIGYRVLGTEGACRTEPSNEVTAHTLPNPPATLAATSVSSSQIDLSWTDSNNHDVGYEVLRSLAGADDFVSQTAMPVGADSLPTATVFWSDTGAAADTEYDYRVRALTPAGDTSPPAPVTAWSRPNAVSNLSAQRVSSTQIDLTWTDTNTHETSFRIERQAGAGGSYEVLAAALAPDTESYSDDTLETETEYGYRVYTVNPGGDSLPAEAQEWTAPAAVEDLEALSISNTLIVLLWSDPNSNETGYRVDRRLAGTGSYALLDDSLAADTEDFEDDTVNPDTEYEYRVTVLSAAGESLPAAVSGWSLPNPPGSFVVTGDSAVSTALTWTDTNANEVGYRLERQAGGIGGFVLLTDSLAPTESHGDSGLAPDTVYAYRLYAVNPGGQSVVAEAQGLTWPGPVTGLTATSLTATSVQLDWSDPNTNEIGHRVERRLSGSGNYTVLDDTLGADAVTYTDTTGNADTAYDYRVVAINPSGESTAANVVGWTRPNPPSGLTATTGSPSEIQLVWTDTNANEVAYRVDHSEGATGTYVTVNDALAVDTESFDDTLLTADTTYAFRVYAENPGGLSTPAEATADTSFAPQLAWDGPPVLDASCDLAIAGTTTLDSARGATFSGSTGTIERLVEPLDLVASATGLAGPVTDFVTGTFQTSWTVTDSFSAFTTLDRELELVFTAPIYVTPTVIPAYTLGEDDMDGRQWWFPTQEAGLPLTGCTACEGLRGSIAATQWHTCGLTASGALKCWGGNGSGQLGKGDTGSSSWPVDVCAEGGCGNGTLSDVVAVAVGGNTGHSCALLSNGEVKCWGRNSFGQLGYGTAIGPEDCGAMGGPCSKVPVGVCASGTGAACPRLTGVVSLVATEQTTCVVTGAGNARCWGANSYGQLGDGGTTSPRTNPVPVCVSGSLDGGDCVELGGVVDVRMGRGHACALNQSGNVSCWGSNSDGGSSGLLGDGTADDRLNPVSVCATGSTNSGDCVPLSSVVAIAGGNYHTCARTGAGGVRCWGGNGSGQLGDGTTASRLNPVDVCETGSTDTGDCVPLTGVVGLSAGGWSTCALLDDDSLRCWGGNYYGQVGDGGTGDRVNPVTYCETGSVAGGDCTPLRAGVGLAVGLSHTCVLLESGGIVCRGWNNYAQLGNGTTGSLPNPDLTPVCNSGSGGTCDPFASAAVRSCGELEVVVP